MLRRAQLHGAFERPRLHEERAQLVCRKVRMPLLTATEQSNQFHQQKEREEQRLSNQASKRRLTQKQTMRANRLRLLTWCCDVTPPFFVTRGARSVHCSALVLSNHAHAPGENSCLLLRFACFFFARSKRCTFSSHWQMRVDVREAAKQTQKTHPFRAGHSNKLFTARRSWRAALS